MAKYAFDDDAHHTGSSSMYDRKLKNPRPIPASSSAIRSRIETLVGVTGWRMARFRSTWKDVFCVWFQLVWRPHLLAILCFEVNHIIHV